MREGEKMQERTEEIRKHDDLPESAFMMVGTIEEAVAKAKGNK